MPLFQQSCTLTQGSCHGQMNNSVAVNLYLGDIVAANNTPAVSSMVYAGLVGVKTKEDPMMNFITAGDTSQSYLLHKLADEEGMFAADCNKAQPLCDKCSPMSPCGGLMPYLGENYKVHEPMQYATIEAWISQGAKNN